MNLRAQNLLDGTKGYGKIEYDYDDDILLVMIGAAMDTLAAAGISKDNPTDLYKLAVERLALHYYENREEVGNVNVIPMGMSWMIDHLRLNDAL